jgi:predicted enzyme involved in methoxymalonyl-ACP biosynthesis
MGKYIEDRILDYIENQLYLEGFAEFRTYYYPSHKNKPAADFFDRLGYEPMKNNPGNDQCKQYILRLKEKPMRKSYARLTEL